MARKMKLIGIGSAAIAATALLSACVAPPSQPPAQVSSDVPSVTYEYRGDDQLLAANQRAVDYCSQYKSMPGDATVRQQADGKTKVRFECNKPLPNIAAAVPPAIPPLTNRYATDQELLIASQNAQNYCYEQGSTLATSTVTNNSDGTHTATFQCAPR